MVPVLFIMVSFLSNRVIDPWWGALKGSQRIRICLLTFSLTALALWIRPLPMPDIAQAHDLIIRATGDKNRAATNSLVEVREIRFLTDRLVPNTAMVMSPDWQVSEQVFYSKGGPDSQIEIKGNTAAGLLV